MENYELEDSSGGRMLVIDIPEDLGRFLSEPNSWRNHCIYKVPKKLRKLNEDAFTPRELSIGPLHHNKDMEKQKLTHLAIFCQKTRKSSTDFEMRIRFHEERIRECYELENHWTYGGDFAKMIMLDSVFIIELLLKGIDLSNYDKDFILGKPWLSNDILLDLVLLENQIPYFVLEDLYNFALPPGHNLRRYSFFRLACWLLWCFICPREFGINTRAIRSLIDKFEEEHYDEESEAPKIRHLLDLLRKFRIYSLPKTDEFYFAKNLYGATKLHEAGVEFHLNPNARPLEVKFENGVLTMPRFEVEDDTEIVIRNLMAFEQCHYPNEPYTCSYISLLDSLINTAEDVDLLVKRGVLIHFLGDSEAVARMFNGLDREITHTSSPYFDTIVDLNKHYKKRWNHTVAIMKRVYFNNLWRGTATVAAIILLFVALIQAASSIRELFNA